MHKCCQILLQRHFSFIKIHGVIAGKLSVRGNLKLKYLYSLIHIDTFADDLLNTSVVKGHCEVDYKGLT